jgi:hypothetical protein
VRHDDIFHPDFTPSPYWWEAYKRAIGDLVDVPRTARPNRVSRLSTLFGKPLFPAAIGSYYRLRDRLDRMLA